MTRSGSSGRRGTTGTQLLRGFGELVARLESDFKVQCEAEQDAQDSGERFQRGP